MRKSVSVCAMVVGVCSNTGMLAGSEMAPSSRTQGLKMTTSFSLMSAWARARDCVLM